ncbi:MAG TPA: hypothetical protein VFA90_12850 [Terriglobales bacterium]|nr:hypothetical protein [Terriglobales bacterium]
MPWELYDYVSRRGENVIKQWCGRLQKRDLIRLTQRIDKLAESGHELCPGLAGPIHNSRHLYKIKVNGNVAARLFLCKGPISMETEYTLLFGAFESDDKLPAGTLETAEQYRQEIISDRLRRCIHERLTI